MKYLIGWEAHWHDYKDGKPSPAGTNFTFHQYFYEKNNYDQHILLYNNRTVEDKNRVEQLSNFIKSQYDDEEHKIVPTALEIIDVISLNEIKPKVIGAIESLKLNPGDEIDFFISPGTPTMQVVWHLIHLELINIKSRLLQTRPGKHTKDGKPELLIVEIEKSSAPNTLIEKKRIDLNQDQLLDEEFWSTPSLERVYSKALKVAMTDGIHVLIQGDTGVGKEHLAKYVHANSTRNNKPFIVVNCSAFSDELLGSELFGHEKGAFTGAEKSRKGLFEEAHGGVIFLDEIGDISPFMQQSLLRVIQNGEIRPIGSSVVKKVDVRIISATHKNLVKLCEKGKFRWDLFYRLSTATLRIPSLIERGKEELESYLNFMISSLREKLKQPVELVLSEADRKRLLDYQYPGNLREMQNIISTLYVFSEDGEVNVSEYIPLEGITVDSNTFSLEEAMYPHERKHFEKVLKHTNGNVKKTSELMEISINTMKKKAERLGVDIESFRTKV